MANLTLRVVLSAVLNFLLPGLGYWYLGFQKVMGVHPIIFLVLVWIVEAVITFVIPSLEFLSLIISIFLACDAYMKATGKPGWVNVKRN